MTDVLIKGGNRHTYSQERAQCGDGGGDEGLLPRAKHTRDRQQTARSQGTGSEQRGSQSPQEEHPCWHPGLRAPASRTAEQEISGVDASQFVVLWYNSFREPAHMHARTLGRPWPGEYHLLTACSLAGWRGGGQLNRNFLAVMKVTAGVLGLVCESTMHTPSFSKLYSSSRVHAC